MKNLRPSGEELDPSEAVFNRAAFTSCLVLNVAEFLCFVVIFAEMYRHHRRHVDICLSNKPREINVHRPSCDADDAVFVGKGKA